MNKYTVTVRPIDESEPGAFVLIRDVECEFSHWDDNENEVHTIYADRDIDLLLDQSDGVISYYSQVINPTDQR